MRDDLDPAAITTPAQFSAALRDLAAGRFNCGRKIPLRTIRARIRVLHVVDRILRDCGTPETWPFAPLPVLPPSRIEIEEWLADSRALPDPVSLGRLLAACLVPAALIQQWQDALHRVENSTAGQGMVPGLGPALRPVASLTFLSHSSADKPAVHTLYDRLTADGVRCWLDEQDLLPGQDWESEIMRALDDAERVLVCLSRTSLAGAGFMRREVEFALDRAMDRRPGTIYLIPVRLEPCDIPRELKHLHHVDLFTPIGYTRLVHAIRHGFPVTGRW
ncbi:toll/interleukin-1 receptor domain-containing protein [Pseudonocardia humida]|uniref:Toll/interleukin-1 receptor domain-containing protein n=1 Tax=Pseudonocardia humida TaxID=2800819 RepID=A0ABT0ZX55_9PSEU|nr:toll/interleukin-1 receptor domain-containing protein [Pseudonocardia humida]MCO1655244.1 toll/interleukin-1 receptor domain-containing protein [Pseudonocardia humida]